MPNLYYYCGILGHDEANCPKALRDEMTGVGKSRNLGPWLKAEEKGSRRGLSYASLLSLWKARNDLIFEEKDRSPMEVVDSTLKSFDAFNKAHHTELCSIHQPHQPPPRALSANSWECPPSYLWKINVDAVVDGSNSLMICVVIRDSLRQIATAVT
ncbi:hypothetical protein PIB30_043591 [Stylosanthes scabra]|uniref:Zinc knuckle CX2CX4HX4C domain-containing protein n=1 Tax=Stylosanthes scabra TaxID=79078 RepID=A0ABU6SH65_9FABA|nr:hypothetical protein [Stylosanthes scabra]